MQQQRNLVDVIGIDGRDHRALLDVGEQRDLAPLLLGQHVLATTQQHIRLDTDAAQLLDRMLGRLGLDLVRAADHRHQGEVHVHDLVAAQFHAELPNGL
jgi:hypothetical protein